MSLTSKQRAFLNSQAHTLKPIIKLEKMVSTTKSKQASAKLLMLVN